MTSGLERDRLVTMGIVVLLVGLLLPTMGAPLVLEEFRSTQHSHKMVVGLGWSGLRFAAGVELDQGRPLLGWHGLSPELVVGQLTQSEFLEQGREVSIRTILGEFEQTQITYKRGWVLGRLHNLVVRIKTGGVESIRGMSPNLAGQAAWLSANSELRWYLGTRAFPVIGPGTLQWVGLLDVAAMSGEAYVTAGTGLRLALSRIEGAVVRFDWVRTLVPAPGFDISVGLTQYF